ncbi:MAG: DUF418 domain-containing protein [Actinomycetota bacterium]
MNSAFDRPPAGRTRSGEHRLIGLDVARAIALFGVVLMNYHGMISYPNQSEFPGSFIDRLFDIRTGVLSTRFAAAFVVVAGIGITLLTDSARIRCERTSMLETRLRILRRGSILLIGGYFLDMAWPGTILFYYGAFFIIAAFIFHLRTAYLMVIALADVAATQAVSMWRRSRFLDGDGTAWVSPSNIESLQDFLARTFLGYTHPVLPWMSFLIAGMICGRYLERFRSHSRPIVITSIAITVVTYLVASVVRGVDVEPPAVVYVLTSMHPDERGLAYIVTTLAIAMAAIALIFVSAEKARSHVATIALQRAGQLSLTLYLGHVLFYYAFAEWSGWITGTGIASAIGLAVVYWIFAIAAGSWWHRRVGQGPAELLYRRLGG